MKQKFVNALYWCGDKICTLMENGDWWWLYPTYNFFMTKSVILQDKWGLPDPWHVHSSGVPDL